jgi:hypothetical protein
MELSLNLAWLALALLALGAFVQKRKAGLRRRRASHRTALLAIMCVLVLLFPVVSASDDLHPTQAVLEDASKRVQQMVAPLSPLPPMVPGLLAQYLLATLVMVATWRPVAPVTRVVSLAPNPASGRSPPSL